MKTLSKETTTTVFTKSDLLNILLGKYTSDWQVKMINLAWQKYKIISEKQKNLLLQNVCSIQFYLTKPNETDLDKEVRIAEREKRIHKIIEL
jgi:hypothetical protein